MNKYYPEPGIALVELIQRYGGIKAPEKSYDSLMSGIILALNEVDADKKYMIDRIGHWRQFKDDLRLTDGLALIELKDIFCTETKMEK
jgi:hypothetical protein